MLYRKEEEHIPTGIKSDEDDEVNIRAKKVEDAIKNSNTENPKR